MTKSPKPGFALEPRTAPAENVSDLQAELLANGIKSSLVAMYEWNGFRYTNATDAIAAAKRASANE